jgi:F-type H+-transporting ATPase subunit alpha
MPKTKNTSKEIGYISVAYGGVVKILGLPYVFLHEVLVNEQGQPTALVIGFNKDYIEALLFDENFDTTQPLFRSQQTFSCSIGENVVGRVFNGLGLTLDGGPELKNEKKSVFCSAPSIIDRKPVTTPLSTGIKVIDTTLPLGRGQRELIIGDRKLGKSTLAVDIVLNQTQADPPVKCIYVLCGQTQKKLRDLINLFKSQNTFAYTAIVAATASSTLVAQYLAPFVGCAMAEYFRDQGQDTLIVYDDLTQHAKIYRDIALLLERPPGREAYPGDIFSLHAGLLERAGQLSDKHGGGSLTALPIIETQEGDITSFIPSNLISITDGQIYLERGLYQKKFLPAVNVGLSVSRVGSQAQPPVLRQVIGGIRLALAQHKELQKLAQLETVVSKESQAKIHRGELVLQTMKQNKHTNINFAEQVVLFYVVEEGFFDDISTSQWLEFEDLFLRLLRNRHQKLLEKIKKTQNLNNKIKAEISQIIYDFRHQFLTKI